MKFFICKVVKFEDFEVYDSKILISSNFWCIHARTIARVFKVLHTSKSLENLEMIDIILLQKRILLPPRTNSSPPAKNIKKLEDKPFSFKVVPFSGGELLNCCLEPQTTLYKWLFQLDDSKSLYRKWLFHQTPIYKWLFGVPGG